MFNKFCLFLAIFLNLFLFCQFAVAEYESYNSYYYLQVGNLGLDDTSVDFDIGDGESYQATLSDLPIIAGGAHTVTGGRFIEFGWEAGGLLSWQNDSISVVGCGGCGNAGSTIFFSVDNNFYLIGTYFGGLINIPLAQYARLFATAGPSFNVSSIDINSDNLPSITPIDPPPPEYSNQREYSFDIGWYGTAGLMFSPAKTWEIGVLFRAQDFGVDFNDNYADTKYRGEHLMIVFGAKL